MENRYRSQMDLSWDSIAAADKLLQRWRRISLSHREPVIESARIKGALEEIVAALSNDLDSPRALQILRSFEKDASVSEDEKASLFLQIDRLLGLDLLAPPRERALSAEDEDLLAKRAIARSEKNFQESDRLRDLLADHGIEVRDLPTGQQWQWR
jgi:cysteinyl-tRNA synthetase